MPSGHHRSPERRDRDKGKREWKESRSENRDRSRKYDDSDRHRESNRSNRDEEFSSSSGKKKARKSDKLERISDDDSFDAPASGKKSSKRDSRKLSDDEEFLESIISEKSHRDKNRENDESSTRKRKKTSVESDHVKGETSTKHQVDEYEAVSDENEHSVSPEGPSRKESKKKKRRDRSNSPGRQSYYDEKRRSDLMAEGGRRVFIDYDHRRESKKSRKSKHDDKDENDSKYEDDGRSHYSSRKRSTSPTGKKSKRSRRDEEENLGSQEELDESEKQKTRRERAKDFIARQNELNSSGEQNVIACEDEKPVGSQWVVVTPEKQSTAVKESDIAREHYDPMSPTKDDFKESPKHGGLYDGVDLNENSDSVKRRRSRDRHESLSPSRRSRRSSRRSREKDRRDEKEDRPRECSKSRSAEKVQEKIEESTNKVGNNDFYEDLPSVSPTDETAFDFENANPDIERGRSRSRSHRDRYYKRSYEYSDSKERRKRKSYHPSDMYDESDHRRSSSKNYSKHRTDRSSEDFKTSEREMSKDRSTSGKHGSSLSPGGRFKMPGSPVDPKNKRRSHKDSNGLPSDDLRHSIDKQKCDENYERKRRGSEDRSRERASKKISESRESKDVERMEEEVKESFDDSSHFGDGSRKRDRSPDDNEIEVELPAIEPKFSISDLSHKPQQYSWPRPNDEREIGGLANNRRVPLREKFSAEAIIEKYSVNRSGSGALSLNIDGVGDRQSGSSNIVSVRDILEKYSGRATGARADMEIREKIRKSSASSVSISPSYPLFKNFKNLSRRFLVNSSETL